MSALEMETPSVRTLVFLTLALSVIVEVIRGDISGLPLVKLAKALAF